MCGVHGVSRSAAARRLPGRTEERGEAAAAAAGAGVETAAIGRTMYAAADADVDDDAGNVCCAV